jgi:hypothetical protein
MGVPGEVEHERERVIVDEKRDFSEVKKIEKGSQNS